MMDCDGLEKVTLVSHGGGVEAKSLGVEVDVIFQSVARWLQQHVCRGPNKVLVVEHVELKARGCL